MKLKKWSKIWTNARRYHKRLGKPELLPYMDYLRQKRKSGKGKFN
jgi:hypothetical protein